MIGTLEVLYILAAVVTIWMGALAIRKWATHRAGLARQRRAVARRMGRRRRNRLVVSTSTTSTTTATTAATAIPEVTETTVTTPMTATTPGHAAPQVLPSTG